MKYIKLVFGTTLFFLGLALLEYRIPIILIFLGFTLILGDN